MLSTLMEVVMRSILAAIALALITSGAHDVQPDMNVPLKLFWHTGRGDNFTTGTAPGEQAATGAGYGFVRVEGYVYANAQPSTVPLKLFWNAARGDNFTTATAAGESDAKAAGYTFVRVEGHVYPTATPSTVPLSLFWNAAREDNFTTATPIGGGEAIRSGYQFVRVEGFVAASPCGGMPAAEIGEKCGDKTTGAVACCPSGGVCRAKQTRVCDGWGPFRSCTYIQTVDNYCQ
jgi:hypothetical protein